MPARSDALSGIELPARHIQREGSHSWEWEGAWVLMRVARAPITPARRKAHLRRRVSGRPKKGTPFCMPQAKLGPADNERRRVVGIPARSVPELSGGDGCVRSKNVRVSPSSWDRLPRPCGRASGSRAKGGNGLLPLLYTGFARCASADQQRVGAREKHAS